METENIREAENTREADSRTKPVYSVESTYTFESYEEFSRFMFEKIGACPQELMQFISAKIGPVVSYKSC